MTDPGLEALWKRVLDAWDDDRAHGAFLEHCRQSGTLLEAAVRYRGMAGDRSRGPLAGKRLSAITLLAMADLEAGRSEQPRSLAAAVQIVLILLFLAGTLAMLIILGHP